ncbi:MAG TPA: diguanylate cyclase [Polyangiaceae bacterium]|nr:diguanylate cyclase [Polyangiaceae bacterium]
MSGSSGEERHGVSSAPFPILVADDEAVTRKLLQLTLPRWGYQVQIATNGNEAWELLASDEGPSMAILDWVMPGLDGPTLCERLRELPGKYVYVLMLTARADKHDLVRGLDAGADDYIAKPFSVDELSARLRAGRRILRLEQELRERAARDVLTGLWSRRAIFDLLTRELERARRSGMPLGVAMADLDHFKRVNDTYGHLTGDMVLRHCAQRIQSVLRAYDSVGRYGGEEMLLLLPQCEAPCAWNACERVRAAIESQALDTETGPLHVTLSIGAIVQTVQGDVSGERLIAAADRALYAAKAAGRNRVELLTSVEPVPR